MSEAEKPPEMSDEEAERIVARLAPSGVARKRVFGVLLRNLTSDEQGGSDE